jgi:hypothetical protein
MNPVWALFFKDRFRTPFSVYKMSLAEIVFLVTVIGACGYGMAEGVSWIINAEMNAPSVLDSINN